jgi:hypothetical protein
METKPLIYAAFIAAQTEFEVLKKESNNPYFKSKYADLAAVLDSIKPALKKHKIGIRQVIIDSPDPASEVGYVCVETILFCEDGSELRGGVLKLPAARNDPQAYGSALTYARRYSLMAAVGIAGEDDDGNAASDAIKSKTVKAAKKYSTKDIEDSISKATTVETLKAIWGSLEEQERTQELHELIVKRKEALNG